MNYRHIFHAGNFCDVMKHIIFMRLLSYMKRKEKAFRVIDTHAGIGLYDLSTNEARKTFEWHSGIGRLLTKKASDMPSGVADYLELVTSLNKDEFTIYPGSPIIARQLLRKQDRLTVTELHEDDFKILSHHFSGDHQVKTIHLDGWFALGSFVPPKEKRGCVLIDPPYENRDDFTVMAAKLHKALRRWPGGTYALWYPLKNKSSVSAFKNNLNHASFQDAFTAEIWVSDPNGESQLFGSGMLIINPPYILADELHTILPYLARVMAKDGKAGYAIEVL